MKRTLIGLSLLVGLSTIGYGVYRVLKEQTKLLKSYCWKIKNVVINTFRMDEVYLTFILLLKNQSDIDVTLTNFDLDVFLNNEKVAKVINTDIGIDWKARGVSEIKFDVKFNPKDVFSSISKVTTLAIDIFSNKENVLIGVKGNVTAKHNFIKVSDLPIDYAMSLASITEDKDNDNTYECKI